MSKGILEFSLPEEESEFRLAQKGGAWSAAVEEYLNWLRSICKHGDPKSVDAEACRDKLLEIIGERDLDPYD